jgi:hypothetical protein
VRRGEDRVLGSRLRKGVLNGFGWVLRDCVVVLGRVDAVFVCLMDSGDGAIDLFVWSGFDAGLALGPWT